METTQVNTKEVEYISEEDVKIILTKYGYLSSDTIIENYVIYNASDKMLGFLADYLKLKIFVTTKHNERKLLCFFIKAISRSNVAKANMVKELGLFNKELIFYGAIKDVLDVGDLKPWSAKLVATLNDAMVLEDLSALHYKMRDKFNKFDMQHTHEALKTLARFHASSIIYEEKKSKELGRPYIINEDHEKYLDRGGYTSNDPWFIQCRDGPLDVIRMFSKYKTNLELMKDFEDRWRNVWDSALNLSNMSPVYRNVICHRDLWNNNILFRYKRLEDGSLVPDDCVLVDFQAVRCQPPAGDVMMLLHCNLKPKSRMENLNDLLNFYYEELKFILWNHDLDIDKCLTKDDFISSAKEQDVWGLMLHACLVPQFSLDDDLMTEIFCDTAQFDEILTKDKSTFLKNMMLKDVNYKTKVMDVFDEIIEKYIL